MWHARRVTRDLPDADHVLAAADYVTAVLAPTTADARWDGPAGSLTWSCRTTMAHMANCATAYAAVLARRSMQGAAVAAIGPEAEPALMVEILRSGMALLAAVVRAAGPDDRGFHPFGVADRSGFAAMGCDEILVHGSDVAEGLGVPYDPPADTCEQTLRRLFPWAPPAVDPWAGLRWANGRAPLGDRLPGRQHLWHCAPLSEWDGAMPPRFDAPRRPAPAP